MKWTIFNVSVLTSRWCRFWHPAFTSRNFRIMSIKPPKKVPLTYFDSKDPLYQMPCGGAQPDLFSEFDGSSQLLPHPWSETDKKKEAIPQKQSRRSNSTDEKEAPDEQIGPSLHAKIGLGCVKIHIPKKESSQKTFRRFVVCLSLDLPKIEPSRPQCDHVTMDC